MPLLGKDHLSRGRGPTKALNRFLWSLGELSVISISYLLLYTRLGPTTASFFDSDCLSEPLSTIRPQQANVLMFSIVIYFLKTLVWQWVYSHSNTISLAAVLFVGGFYHSFLVSSIIVPSYVVNRMPSQAELVLVAIVEPLALLHETLADREMSEFKMTKKKGELLDYGYHSACRHPNYFFNSFPIGCIGLLSGSPFVGLFWVAVQVFWACTQSGPALESYMANNYGEKWERYCQQVPFLVPKPNRLYKILTMQYIGDKAAKIKASGRASMFDISKDELKRLQDELKELNDDDDDDVEDDDNNVHNKKD
jgi:protein-S-isoprenylcysteine O-methyltransferase Ste14